MQNELNLMLQQQAQYGSYQLRLKIKHMQQDKQRLQISCSQMCQSIALLRNINKSLITQSLSTSLVQQHASHLQTSYLRILSQNNHLSCHNLMLSQIIQQSQNQYRNILKSYEQKIIQLRRSIQFKEGCIQGYQENLDLVKQVNSNQTNSNVSATQATLIFFTQIQKYKQDIKQLQLQNKLLQQQLTNTNLKLQKVTRKNNQFQLLLMDRNNFYQFRNIFREQIKNGRKHIKSQPKQMLIQAIKDSNKKVEKQNMVLEKKLKKFKQTSLTNQSIQKHTLSSVCYQNQVTPKLFYLKQCLCKKSVQLTKIARLYSQSTKKCKQLQYKLKQIIKANKIYCQKRLDKVYELNYYRKVVNDLMGVINKKGLKRKYSLDKTEVESFVRNVKLPKEYSINNNNKKYWTNLKLQLDEQLKKQKLSIPSNRPKLKRSNSCILDYHQLPQQTKLTKYYLNKQKPLQKPSNQTHQHKQMNDFSQMLSIGVNGEIFNDQTFLISKNNRINYAERKRLKENKSCGLDLHNLTIITENVL